MRKLHLASKLLLLPLHLIASNQIFEAGAMVRLADTSAGLNEAYWLFDSSNDYFGHYPSQAAAAFGYSSYFEKGSYALNSLGNNQVEAQLNSAAYATLGYNGWTVSASRTATVTLTSPFSANYSGTRTEINGVTESFNGNLTIYPAQDYAPEVLPIGSVWNTYNAYYYSAYDSGPDGSSSITVLSGNSLQLYYAESYETSTGSYTYTKLGSNLGRISISDPANYFTASIKLFFRSPSEVYFYGNTTDYYGSYTDWGAISVTYPSSYTPPAIFPAPSALPQNQILQITGTNSDLSLNLAEGSWADASGGSGSFTYTYAVQSGGVAGLTLNRSGQTAPVSSEHFALRFTDDGVGEVVYSSLDGSQSFNLVDAPKWELYDDFSGSALDTQKWETWYWPGGQAPVVTNGQLKLENGGGSGRKEAAFMNTLQSAGFDFSSGTYHSGVAFTDPSIIGVEADLYLPAGVVAESGVTIDLFEQVSSQEIRNAGVELSFWGGSQAVLEFAKSAYSSGTRTSKVEHEDYVTLGQTYRIRILRQDGSIKLYADDVLVQTHDAEGELLAFFIVAFNDVGQSMYATVDNVRVLRDTTIEPPLPVVESSGNTDLLEDDSGYYAGSVDTPLVYEGTQISGSTYDGFTALGVDLVNGAYRVVLFNGSQYYAANFSLSGSSSNAWALVSDILVEEVNLQQDLDDDGYVGTPPIQPPASLAGMSFILTPSTGELKSVPNQTTFAADSFSYGFSGNLLGSFNYSYSNGTIIYDTEERLDLTFTSSTAGTYEEGYVESGVFYVENTGTFEKANISLSLNTNWQRTETMNSTLSTQYWQIGATGGDTVAYNDGELNFTFDSGSSSENQEIELTYAGALPLDEDWQIVIEDTYVSDFVDQFAMGYGIALEGSFDCEFGFGDQGAGREVYFYADSGSEDAYYFAYQSSADDPRIQNGLNFRIQHLASTRELVYSYQPDGVSNWTEVARINLGTGAATGLSGSGSLTGQLPSSSQNLFFEVDIDKYSAGTIPIENIEIGGIEIGSYTPIDLPASLAGKQIEYQPSGGETSSVPWQELYGSDGNAQFGFSGSVIERIPYTYAQGVVTYTIFSEEIRLSFETATSGTYEYVEIDGVDLFVDEVGTFSIVAPTLEVKADDWQRSETMDSSLSTDYWNIARRTVDGVAYNAGELSFIFANGGEPGVDDYPEIDIEYGRTLPLDENWQVVLDDLYASSVSDFRIGFDLSFLDPDSEVDCSFSYGDYGFGGRQVNADVERRGDTYVYSAGAFVRANQDARLQGGVNLRVRHNAASRDLLFEYQPDGASGWTELARLNLGDGTFAGTNQYGDGVAPISGEVISASERFAMDVEVEAGQATQLGDLEIAGIEIGSYTPPVWELYDDFSGSVLDTQKWDLAYWDGGNLPTLSSGRALLSGNTLSNWNVTEVTEAMLQANANAASLVGGDNEAHSILEFNDSESISGIEMQLTLPEGVADNIGIGLYAIDYDVMFNNPNEDPVRFDLDLWKSLGVPPEVQITWKNPVSGLEQSATSVLVTPGQSVLLKFERTADTIRFFVNNVQVAESDYSRRNETFIIRAVSEAGASFMAYVDNVRVLRDTTSEPPLPVVESSGNTDLLEDDSGYYAGSVDTPLVYGGTQISGSTYAGFTALGVDLVNGAYRVILFNGSQYYAANFSLSGSSSNAWALVSDILVEEVNLQQDLDDDGYVGTPPVQPPASLAGKAYQFSIGGDDALSVPLELVFGSATYNEGFAGSLLDANQPYTYANGVVTTDGGDEIRLTYTSATSGSFEYWEYDEVGFYLEDVGTFNLVTPTLVLKNDWQRTETMDSPLSTDYWNIWRRTVDSLAYDDGELSFIFSNSTQEYDADTGIQYGRTLPMDENWQVVLEDIYVAPGLSNFVIELELEIADPEFECEVSFEDYGYGRQFGVFLEQQLPSGDWEYAHASITASEDTRISSGGNVRIVHVASSRELIFEYQPDGASDWSELARLNLESGSFQGVNSYGNLPGGIISTRDHRMAVGIEAEAGVATQLGDLEVAGIEIGSYAPPPPPASPESLVNYKLVGQFTEGTSTYRHDFFFTGSTTVQSHYFVESNDPSNVDDWSEETYVYTKTGATTGIVSITNSTGETTDVELAFGSATTGMAIANGRNGIRPNSASGPFTFVEYDPSELPEPPLPVVESSGNTDLLEDDSGYYAGSVDTPLVYEGTQISGSTYDGFTALGVDLVNGAYRVILFNGSQYYAANFSLSGSSSNAWAPVSDILVEEVNLQQDLDDDGYVGTPPVQPPASLAGLELNHGDGVSYFDSQGVYYGGIQDGYISEKGSWEYYVSDYKGILILDELAHTQGGYKLEVELRFSSPTAGSYQVFEVYDVRPEQANFTGNFTLGARTLLDSVHPDWQYREDFGGASLDSALWSPYTDSGRDEIAVANGLVSVLIDSQSLESDTWAGLDSLRVLPMSESWEVQTRVVADVNRLAGVNNYEIGILLSNYDSVGSGGFEINLEDYGLSAGVINRTSPWDAFRYAYTNALPGLASAHLRIVHDSNTSVVSLAYDVDGATNGWDWEPLIEYQLSDGSGTRWIDGIPEPFNGGTWTLGQDDYLRVDLEAHVGGINGTYNAQAGDLGFDYFEVGSYTPPPTPVDSDDDGLDDSVETNTGVYVSPSDTGTDPNKADSSGDLFTDGEVVSLGLDPNVDYSGLLAIVRNNPDRFEFDDSNSTVDMRLRGLRLGRADNGGFNMNFDLEMSTDLQTWTPHTSHSIELSVPDQSKAFMRLNVK